MAEIIDFKARPRLQGAADAVPSEGASILFFTGVRYERAQTTVDEPKRPAGGGKTTGKRRRRRA
ncbi:MAG: hypothetical protein KGM42_13305 [Hyphomicrobiales bacterium]|nr:hypothetical protein [Hyphomicrobiales bacterium]